MVSLDTHWNSFNHVSDIISARKGFSKFKERGSAQNLHVTAQVAQVYEMQVQYLPLEKYVLCLCFLVAMGDNCVLSSVNQVKWGHK